MGRKYSRKRDRALKEVRTDRIDVDSQDSSLEGLRGHYEQILRRYKVLTQALTLIPLYGLASVIFGLSLVPSILFFKFMYKFESILAIGVGLAGGFFIYGFSLLLIVPLFNKILVGRPKEFRGPYYSAQCIPWYIHNGLTYLVRYTFLEFVTPTPFNLLFFKLMGMKMGRSVQINTAHISDPGLISMGDRVTLGGSATVCAHYGMGGFLVIAPVKIGSNVTVGLRAIILGGVEIGDDVKILPNSVVLPKTKIPSGETWGGVPAQPIQIKRAA
jgi:hypothetical protein